MEQTQLAQFVDPYLRKAKHFIRFLLIYLNSHIDNCISKTQRGQISPFPQNQLKKQPSTELSELESKWEWLKKKMDKKRINWVNGSDTIAIMRNSVLQDSLKQIDLINIHKVN